MAEQPISLARLLVGAAVVERLRLQQKDKNCGGIRRDNFALEGMTANSALAKLRSSRGHFRPWWMINTDTLCNIRIVLRV
jgi:hypothetical protein